LLDRGVVRPASNQALLCSDGDDAGGNLQRLWSGVVSFEEGEVLEVAKEETQGKILKPRAAGL